MKNAFDGLSNSLDTAEERINDLEMSVGTYETMQRDRMKKFKQDMQEPWDNYKRCYICIIGKKKERGMEETIETMMIGNFLKLMIDMEPQSQKLQKTPGRIITKRKKTHLDIAHLNFRKSKIKQIFKEAPGWDGGVHYFIYRRARIRRASQVALAVKNPPASAGDIRNTDIIPGLERSLGEGNGNPLQYSCLENPRD